MTGPTYEEKRRIFERHFLLGKLSGDEIDTLLQAPRRRIARLANPRRQQAKVAPPRASH